MSFLEPDETPLPLPTGKTLDPLFFARPSSDVASELVGKILWRPGLGGGRLTEVEAYLPFADPASHSSCGPTRRNAAMFGPPGTIYVFLSYGVHYLLNLVCESEGVGSAVLIRAFESLEAEAPGSASCCGPGRVGAALDIGPGLNGLPLGPGSAVYVVDDGRRPQVGITTRVGITRGAALPLRYYACGSTCVTRGSALPGGTRE